MGIIRDLFDNMHTLQAKLIINWHDLQFRLCLLYGLAVVTRVVTIVCIDVTITHFDFSVVFQGATQWKNVTSGRKKVANL